MKKIIGYILVILSFFILITLLFAFFETGAISDGLEIAIYGVFTVFFLLIAGLGVYLIRSAKRKNQTVYVYPDNFYFKTELFLRFTLTPKEYLTGILQIFPNSRIFIYAFPIAGVSNLILPLLSPELDEYVGPDKDVLQVLIEQLGTIIMIFIPLIVRFLLIRQFKSNEGLSGMQTYHFDGEMVVSTANGFESQFSTLKYNKVKITPNLVILFIKKYQGTIIPRRAFTHPHEWEIFLEAIQNENNEK